jgi:hypothetical protein
LLADKFNQIESSIWKAVGEFCHFMFVKKSNVSGVVCALDRFHIPFYPKKLNKTPYRN